MSNEPALKITGDQVITGTLVVDPENAARIEQAVREQLPRD